MENIIDKLSKYAEVKLNYDTSHLSKNEVKILDILIDATRVVDEIYWIQNSHDGINLRDEYEDMIRIQANDSAFHESIYMDINYGPYDVLKANERFCSCGCGYGCGSKFKYKGAGFYPDGLTKEEFEDFVHNNPDKANELLRIDTMIRGDKDNLYAIPYKSFFSDAIARITRRLRAASDICDNQSFKDYLLTRANDLEGDSLKESDIKWLNLKDSPFDLVIGPIEIYDDQLMGIKASYQGIVLGKRF